MPEAVLKFLLLGPSLSIEVHISSFLWDYACHQTPLHSMTWAFRSSDTASVIPIPAPHSHLSFF